MTRSPTTQVDDAMKATDFIDNDSLRDDIPDFQAGDELKVHVGVGNAFLDEARPDAYDAPSAREAWNDILSFLRAELA